MMHFVLEDDFEASSDNLPSNIFLWLVMFKGYHPSTVAQVHKLSSLFL